MSIAKIWVGGAGAWNTASDWSPEGIPDASDDVTISAPATVTLSGTTPGIADALTISGSSTVLDIDDDAARIVTDVLNLSSLALVNGGLFAATVTNDGAITLSLGGLGSDIAATSLINDGALIISGGSNTIAGAVSDSGITTIASGARLTSDGSWSLDAVGISGSGRFVNDGSFVSEGFNTVAVAFVNAASGTLAVNSGYLYLEDGIDDSGSVSISAGTLGVTGTSTIAGYISGSGRLVIGGTAVLAADLTFGGTYNQYGTLSLRSSAALILTGTNNTLDSATINGSGVLLNRGQLAISGGELAGGAILRNGQTGTIRQSGTLVLVGSAQVENASGGIYDFHGGFNESGSGASFVNDGSFVVDLGGPGVESSNTVAFVNKSTGTISVNSGILNLKDGVNDSGSVSISADGQLHLGGVSTITGPISGSGALDIGGMATITTDLTFGGTFGLYGTLSLMTGMALILTGASSTMAGGTVTGSGVLLNRGQLATSGGELAGNAILRNGTTGIVQQTATLILAGAAQVENAAGGLYELENNSSISAMGSGARFVNGGDFVFSGGGTDVESSDSVAFVNESTGTISVNSGFLNLEDGVNDSGSISIADNSTLVLSSGDSTIVGPISGSGGLEIGGGMATIATDLTFGGYFYQYGASTLSLMTGEALILAGVSGTMAGGTVTGSGVLLNRGRLTIYGGEVAGSAILRNGTTGIVQQTATLILAGAAQVENAVGGLYELENDSSISAMGAGVSFVDGGSFVSSLGTNTVATAFTNKSGATISVVSKTLAFTGAVTDAGATTIAGGATLTSGDAWSLSDAAISGDGSFDNDGSFISIPGSVSGTDSITTAFFNEAEGLLSVASGTLAFTGEVTDLGAVTIAAGATVTSHDRWNLTASLAGSGSFINDGSFISAETASFDGRYYFGASSNTVTAAFINSSGAQLLVNSGTLDLIGGFTDDAQVSIAADATLKLDGGTGTIAGEVVGSGLFEIAAGDVTFSAGADLATGRFELSGGTAVIDTNLPIYAGGYDQAGGTLDLLSGRQLTLSGTGTLAGATIAGSGELLNQGQLALLGGAVSALDGSVTLNNHGTIIQGSGLTVAATAMISNSGDYDLIDASITGSGSFVNDGSLVSSGSASVAAATLTNSGTITVQSGSLSLTGALDGTGTDEILGSATLTFGGTVSSGQTVTFASGYNGRLDLSQAQSFDGMVAGLVASKAIDLTNFAFAGATITGVTGGGGMGTTTDVTVQDGLLSVTLDLLNQTANQYSTIASSYQLAKDNNTSSPGTLFELAPT